MQVNGNPGSVISIRDRGLLYGDGVFRTFVAAGGKALHWPLHYRKIKHDCIALRIPYPEEAQLTAELDDLLAQNPDGVVKLIVTRGEGARGYAPPKEPSPTLIWDISPLPENPAEWVTRGIKARLCQTRLCHQPQLAGIKHLNRLENVLAAAELADAGADDSHTPGLAAEGLLLDTAGNVIEGTRSNLFMVFQGNLVTPDLSRCGVAGVQRDRVMVWAKQHKVPLQVRNIGLDEVFRADELFLVNSVFGLWPIRHFEHRSLSAFPLAGQIRSALFEQET